MDADSQGSFAIVVRLAQSLRNVPEPDTTLKRKRLLASFFERCSTEPSHLVAILQLLFAVFPNAGSKRTLATDELYKSLLSDALCRCVDAVCEEMVEFSSSGSLSIRESIVFCRSLIALSKGTAVDSATVQLVRDTVRSRITANEWTQLKCIAAGDSVKMVGPHVTLYDTILQVFGPYAADTYKSQMKLLDESHDATFVALKAAVQSVSDGSPRMMRESSLLMVAPDLLCGNPCVAQKDHGNDEEFAAAVFGSPTVPSSPVKLPPANSVAHAGPSEAAKRDVDGGKRGRVEEALPVAKVARTEERGLPPCMYGERCIRKNPDHFKQFSHPAGLNTGVPSAAPKATVRPTSPPPPAVQAAAPKTDELNPVDFAVNGIAPLRVMKPHEFVMVDNTGGNYKMKNCGDGTYTCNCPVWRYQNKATNERTCKHLQAYLGDAFERARCQDVYGPEAHPPGHGSPSTTPVTTAAGGGAKKVTIPGVLLANKATNKGDYLGWWVSEKLDGVRAYWNGTYLLSRNGNVFTAPDWFTKALPAGQTLDGELFGGRKKFQSTVGIVKSSAAHPGWKTLTYEIFDIPSSGSQPFEKRVAQLQGMFPVNGPVAHVHVVEHEKCKGAQHIADRLAEVEAVGGEGLMLREPGSKYVNSRSNTLLKVKSTEEVDAVVRGHDPGKGKHEGRCGALLVELVNGKQFCVGSGLSDAQRAKPPSIGTVIIVRFQELTDGGIPRFPVFAGCRYDIDWPPKTQAK